MPQSVTTGSLPEAFDVIKEMQADGCAWGEGYHHTGRREQPEYDRRVTD